MLLEELLIADVNSVKEKPEPVPEDGIINAGDLSGAVSVAMLHIPAAISYGMIVFMPLGPEFAAQGAVFGLYSAIIVGFFAALFGGTPIQVTGPIASISLILASITAYFSTEIPQDLTSREFLIIALLSLCIFLGGLFQILFGVLRLGRLMKYIPHQVLAGFANGIALILLAKQIKPFLGIDNNIHLLQVLEQPGLINWTSFLVGGVTLAAIYIARIRFKSNTAFLYGMIAGSFAHYLLAMTMAPENMGRVIGNFCFILPQPVFLSQWLHLSEKLNIWSFLPHLLVSGFVLAVIGSIHALLCSMVSDDLTRTAHNPNREVFGQGIGNMAGSFFGALFGTGAVTRMMVNHSAGAKTRASGMLSSIIILIAMFGLDPLIAKIPMAALSAIIISIALAVFDTLTITLLKQVKNPFSLHRDTRSFLAVSLVVTMATISINLIVAILIGIIIASVIFISKMGSSMIRENYYADDVPSKKMRPWKETDILKQSGKKIAVFELQGPIFFGSAANLAVEIRKKMQSSLYCILDLKNVNYIDINGINSFGRIRSFLEENGKHLLISNIQPSTGSWQYFKQMDTHQAFEEHILFPDIDRALEWAENHLLEGHDSGITLEDYCSLGQQPIVKGFLPGELKMLEKSLVKKTCSKGEELYKIGQESHTLYIILKGGVTLSVKKNGINTRIVTFSRGLFFGETALFDNTFRLSSAIADEPTEVALLSEKEYHRLAADYPATANKLIVNIASEISKRHRQGLFKKQID